jgi:cytochrome c oxidase assembly protein subunit 15
MASESAPAQDQGRDGIWLHRLALLTAAATLPLLFIGGLVTSKGAGLAVPDWPTTFGYNMFLYPWSKMVGGILYEHTHRLVASAVGLLTVLLALFIWFGEKRRWLRWLGIVTLVFVILQGVIGGLRVVLLEETLAILHACFAQAFFALVAGMALFTSRGWKEESGKIQLADAGRIQRLSLLTTGMIYLQGVFGAVLRYTGDALELHLVFAALVVFHVFFLAARILKSHSRLSLLVWPAVLLFGLLLLQLALGLGSYAGKFTSLGSQLPLAAIVFLRTSHVVTGALMLVTSLVLTLRSYRMLQPAPAAWNREFLSEPTSV